MKIIYTAFILFTFFQGCLNFEQRITLEQKGAGTMHLHYWMIVQAESIPDSIALSFFNEDSLDLLFTADGITIDRSEVYAEPSDSTLHTEIELSFVHLDSLNKVEVLSSSEFSLTDGADGQKILTQFIPPRATGHGFEDSLQLISYEYTFPGLIITHNAQQREGQTLRWEYKPSEIGRGKTISVTYKESFSETPLWIYILAGSISLLVLYALLRKKRK